VPPLPPIQIQVGGEEALLDDARPYAVEARKAGARSTIELWQGMHHVFQLDVKTLANSRQALDRAAVFLRSGR
jgi:epsilon-lactone hydrolase